MKTIIKKVTARPGEYPQKYAGDWVAPNRKYYRMMCCDCGLVHKLEFALVRHGNGRVIVFRAWRDNEETAKHRKPHQLPCQLAPKKDRKRFKK